MPLLHGDLGVEMLTEASPCCTINIKVQVGPETMFYAPDQVHVMTAHLAPSTQHEAPVCCFHGALAITILDENGVEMGHSEVAVMKPGRQIISVSCGEEVMVIAINFVAAYPRPQSQAVSGAAFPMRYGGNIEFFNDAHTTLNPSHAPHMPGASRLGLFKSIQRSVAGARKMILVAGWRVWPNLRLDRAKDSTLGKLLIRKANEGVVVLVMVWKPEDHIADLMDIQMDELHDTFYNTKVIVVLMNCLTLEEADISRGDTQGRI